MRFRDHLPLGQVPHHNSAFNQCVDYEMTCFVQTVAALVALALRDALIDPGEVDVASRLLLAAVPFGAKLVQLLVVPAGALEAADVVEPASSVVADGQRLDPETRRPRPRPRAVPPRLPRRQRRRDSDLAHPG